MYLVVSLGVGIGNFMKFMEDTRFLINLNL